jgi:hypothetical protein
MLFRFDERRNLDKPYKLTCNQDGDPLVIRSPNFSLARSPNFSLARHPNLSLGRPSFIICNANELKVDLNKSMNYKKIFNSDK